MMEQGKDGARNPAGFPTLCAAALFFFGFFRFLYYGGRDSSSWRKVKERGIYRCQSTIHGDTLPSRVSFGAVPVALVNETVAMGVAICVDPIAAAAAAPDILALQTGLLCTPYTNGVIVARRREHVGICRIPAYTIDCARVTSQSLDEIPGGSMPNVDLKI